MMTDWDGPHAVPDLFQLACAGEIASGCNRLGEHYEQGSGVPEDDAISVRYYSRSCSLDDAYGCSHLAEKMRDGEGVAADRVMALTLFIGACRDYVPACTAGADLAMAGEPDAAGLMTALKLTTQACTIVNRTCPAAELTDLRARVMALHLSPGAAKPILISAANNGHYPIMALRRNEQGRSNTHFTVLPDGTHDKLYRKRRLAHTRRRRL